MKTEKKTRGVFFRDGAYWIQYYDASGARRREKIGSKGNAIKLAEKRRTERLEGKKLPENLRKAPASFREIAETALEYSKRNKRSYQHDVYRMRHLRDWFGDRPAESITPEEIEEHIEHQDWKPATQNRYRALLSLTYRLAIKAKKLQANPARLVEHRKEDNARTVFLSKNDEVKLRAKIRELYPEHEPEFDLALYTGMRKGEQYAAAWEDVDWERRQLTIPRSKNGTMRHLPLNASAMRALTQLRSRPAEPLSTESVQSGFPTKGRATSPLICGGVKSPRGWFEPAVKAAGLRDYTWHSNRHSFASRLVMAGVDLRTVAELMGHKTLAMVMRYSHLAPDHQQEAVGRLDPTATRTATGAAEVVAYVQ